MANNATLAGHVHVDDFAILGGLSAIHQYVRIGKHAMVGGMSGVEHDVIPYGLSIGNRNYLQGLNLTMYIGPALLALWAKRKTCNEQSSVLLQKTESV